MHSEHEETDTEPRSTGVQPTPMQQLHRQHTSFGQVEGDEAGVVVEPAGPLVVVAVGKVVVVASAGGVLATATRVTPDTSAQQVSVQLEPPLVVT